MYSNIEDAWKLSNDLDKYKKAYKPATNVKDATNELTASSAKSVPSDSHFETELRDLKKLKKMDDGSQCDRLFSHFQGCKKCRTAILEKFTLNNPSNLSVNSLNLDSLNLDSLNFNMTENFIDLSKYTSILKNKNSNNIISIILFGLLVIIILSMINNEQL